MGSGRCGISFKSIIFKTIIQNNSLGTHEIVLWWIQQNLIDKSTMVQEMAGCHQATSHYLSQCMLLYGITRPQRVKLLIETWVLLQFSIVHPHQLIRGLVMPYAILELGQHWVPSGNKPLPEPLLTYHKWKLLAFTWGQFYRKCSRYLSLTEV